MTDYSKITALYSRLSVGDEDRDGGESNSIQNQKIFLENYARGQHLTNIRHYIDDDESGRFFDRSAYEDVKTIIRMLKAEGKTIFLTSHHYKDIEQLCDQVYSIEDCQLLPITEEIAARYREME